MVLTVASLHTAFQLTSKLWSTWHSRVEQALDKTLSDLGTDYLDRMYPFLPLSLVVYSIP